MSIIADAFQPRLISALFGMSGRAEHCHIPDILIAVQAAYDLEFDLASKTIIVDFREPAYLANNFCGDACRFASAAFSSLYDVGSEFEDQRSFPWSIVRMYYAAFYAGHAIIRLLGASCSFLYGNHTSRITGMGAAAGRTAPFPIKSGLYECKLTESRSGIKLTSASGRVGGAHESFWNVFENYISSISEDSLRGHLAPNDARAVFAKLESFRSVLNRGGGGGSWLSSVRNDVQYRHGLKAWVPSSIKRGGRDLCFRISQQWERDPIDIDIEAPPGDDLGKFFAASAFSISLCRALLFRIGERSSVGKRSFAYGPLALCTDHRGSGGS